MNDSSTSGSSTDNYPDDIDIDFDSSFESNSIIQNEINDIMSHKYESNATYAQIVKLAKKSKIPVPKTKDVLKRKVEKRFEKVLYVHCENCSEFVIDGFCRECGVKTTKSEQNSFIYIPLRIQIKYFLKEFFNEIITFLNSCKQRNGFISDIYDGSILKSIEEYDSIILSFTLNADGAQCAKSTSKKSIWLVQLYQNYLPPEIRYKRENVILCALRYGRDKLNLAALLYPLSVEMDDMRESKITALISGKFYKFHPQINIVSCDLPARAEMAGMKSFSGYNSCPHCLHPGVRIRNENGRSYVRYISLDEDSQIRHQEHMLSSMEHILSHTHLTEFHGIKKISPMLLFPNFDIANGFVTDYLHCVLLGVTKRVLDIWTGTVKTNKFKTIDHFKRNVLNNILSKIKPISGISRKPANIFDRSHWKAAQYGDMLLYYLYYAISGLIDFRYVEHFRKFSAAIYILLKKKIEEHEIVFAEKLLSEFSNEFEQLYGQNTVTMNIHLLTHLTKVVRIAGPLWVYSTFAFESNIGRLIATKNGTTDFTDQIATTYCLARQRNATDNNGFKLFGLISIIETNIRSILSEAGIGAAKCYSHLTIGGVIFKSEKSRVIERIDHFVEMFDEEIGSVVLYAQFESQMYAIIRKYLTVDIKHHFRQVQRTEILEVHRFSEISSKVMYLNFGVREVVTKRPHSH